MMKQRQRSGKHMSALPPFSSLSEAVALLETHPVLRTTRGPVLIGARRALQPPTLGTIGGDVDAAATATHTKGAILSDLTSEEVLAEGDGLYILLGDITQAPSPADIESSGVTLLIRRLVVEHERGATTSSAAVPLVSSAKQAAGAPDNTAATGHTHSISHSRTSDTRFSPREHPNQQRDALKEDHWGRGPALLPVDMARVRPSLDHEAPVGIRHLVLDPSPLGPPPKALAGHIVVIADEPRQLDALHLYLRPLHRVSLRPVVILSRVAHMPHSVLQHNARLVRMGALKGSPNPEGYHHRVAQSAETAPLRGLLSVSPPAAEAAGTEPQSTARSAAAVYHVLGDSLSVPDLLRAGVRRASRIVIFGSGGSLGKAACENIFGDALLQATEQASSTEIPAATWESGSFAGGTGVDQRSSLAFSHQQLSGDLRVSQGQSTCGSDTRGILTTVLLESLLGERCMQPVVWPAMMHCMNLAMHAMHARAWHSWMGTRDASACHC